MWSCRLHGLAVTLETMGDMSCGNGVFDCNGRWAAGRTYVYIAMVRDAGGPMYVKVGISEDPYSRVPQLQTGCPIKIIRAGMVKCASRDQAKRIEKKMHADLAPRNTVGEWFRFDWNKEAERAFLQATLESNFAEVREWKFEEMDLEKAWAIKRATETYRRGQFRERKRRREMVRKAVTG